MLITILEKDDLVLDEIEIWSYVIRWGIQQSEELSKDISEWSKDDFEQLKNTLEDIIPLIRFDEISSDDFFNQILQFKRIFDKEVYKEILGYYLNNEWKPKLLLQRGPRLKKGLLRFLVYNFKCK